MDKKTKQQIAMDTIFFVMGAVFILCALFTFYFQGFQFTLLSAGFYLIGAVGLLMPYSFHHFKRLNMEGKKW